MSRFLIDGCINEAGFFCRNKTRVPQRMFEVKCNTRPPTKINTAFVSKTESPVKSVTKVFKSVSCLK